MRKLSGATQTLLTEGMGGRLKTKGGQLVPFTHRVKRGQLVPLKQRLNHTEIRKRVEKMSARRTVAERLLAQQQAFMIGVTQALQGHFNRGFFGRMKYLFAGK